MRCLQNVVQRLNLELRATVGGHGRVREGEGAAEATEIDLLTWVTGPAQREDDDGRFLTEIQK